MQFRKNTIHILEKVFWIFLFINPLLDIFNGFFISNVLSVGILDVEFVSTLGVTPSLIIRMLFLLLFALYLLLIPDKKAIFTAIPIVVAWILSVYSEYHSTYTINFFIDAQYMARFCYNVAILLVYSKVFIEKQSKLLDHTEFMNLLDNIVVFTLFVLSLAILIPALLGVGYSTYADRLGYRGNRGFFYAGNDITAILTLLLPIAIVRTIRGREISSQITGKQKSLFLPALASALAANSLLIIGSKTAFLALIFEFGLLFVFVFIFLIKTKNGQYFKEFCFLLSVTVIIFLILNVLSYIQVHNAMVQEGFNEPFKILDIFRYSGFFQAIQDSANATELLAENEGATEAFLNGRQVKLAEQFSSYLNGGIVTWLFGLGRGSQEVIIEMDVFEVICYYGILGLVTMLWLYVKVAIDFFKNLFKNFSITAFALFLSLGLTVGYLIIAGHVLFSVTSGFYLSFVILYSRAWFANFTDKISLWNTSNKHA